MTRPRRLAGFLTGSLLLTGSLAPLAAAPARAADAAAPDGSVATTAPAPAVTVAVAADREIVERAVVTGTLVPRDEILVSPEIEGSRVTELLAEEATGSPRALCWRGSRAR